MRKPRIAVVAGIVYDMGMLNFLEPLQKDYDITVFALSDGMLMNHLRSSLDVKVFSEIKDMPGYMRGFESSVGSADLVVCLESSRLASFQGLRVCMKLGIPSVVMTTETTPYKYINYSNIRAIQDDVYRNASLFVPTSELAQEKLLVEGVDLERIRRISVGTSLDEFSFSDAKRDKFRKYIGIGRSEVLMLFKGDLSDATRPQEVLQALLIIYEKNPVFASRLLLLFAGEGPKASDLKYLATDLKLGKRVMFLDQEIAPFAADLFSASDIIIYPKNDEEGNVSVYPRWLLDAMACRAVPLYSQGSDAKELVGDAGVEVDMGAFALSEAILGFADQGQLHHRRIQAETWVKQSWDRDGFISKWKSVFEEALGMSVKSSQVTHDGIQDIAKLIQESNFQDALLGIEHMELSSDAIPNTQRATLAKLKGDAYLGLNDLLQAMEQYGKVVEIDPECWEGHLGLAQIAFRSHSYQEAFSLYKKVLSRDPHNVDALLGMGLVHKGLGMLEDASYWLNKCLNLDADNGRALLAVTHLGLEFNDVNRGIEIMESAREIVGEVPSLILALGKLYIKGGRGEHGRQLMSQAIRGLRTSSP